MTETRQERFKRLAIFRTNAVLEKIRILGNLSNKANYEYSDDDINKIFYAIDSRLRVAKTRFTHKTKKEFTL